MGYDIVSLYYFIDEFCKAYEEWEGHKLLPSTRQRQRECRLRLSEMLTIIVIFHLSPCKNLKWFYQAYLPYRHGHDFPGLVCYDRFVALMPRLFLPLHLLLHSLMGEESGIYFMDATHLPVCHNRRIQRNRVFNGMAERGKSSMGWFYGFKLHIVINHKGQLMAAKITRGNVDDRAPADAMTATYYVGTMKGVGRIYQQTFVDTYSRVAMCKLYTEKTAITAADALNDKVLPFFAEHDIPLLRVLTDRGTEYCGKVENHAYQLYLAVENIDHSRTKASSTQTNGSLTFELSRNKFAFVKLFPKNPVFIACRIIWFRKHTVMLTLNFVQPVNLLFATPIVIISY